MAGIVISLLIASFYAVQPAYAAGPGGLAASFLGFFEYKLDVDADNLFPSEQIRNDLISKSTPRQFTIKEIEREVAGFSVNAQDVLMQLSPSKVDSSKTRIDVDIQGKSIEIDSSLLKKKYSDIYVEGIYGIYDANTEKVTIHVPLAVALLLLLK